VKTALRVALVETTLRQIARPADRNVELTHAVEDAVVQVLVCFAGGRGWEELRAGPSTHGADLTHLDGLSSAVAIPRVRIADAFRMGLDAGVEGRALLQEHRDRRHGKHAVHLGPAAGDEVDVFLRHVDALGCFACAAKVGLAAPAVGTAGLPAVFAADRLVADLAVIDTAVSADILQTLRTAGVAIGGVAVVALLAGVLATIAALDLAAAVRATVIVDAVAIVAFFAGIYRPVSAHACEVARTRTAIAFLVVAVVAFFFTGADAIAALVLAALAEDAVLRGGFATGRPVLGLIAFRDGVAGQRSTGVDPRNRDLGVPGSGVGRGRAIGTCGCKEEPSKGREVNAFHTRGELARGENANGDVAATRPCPVAAGLNCDGIGAHGAPMPSRETRKSPESL
jgi:hypothetical protein